MGLRLIEMVLPRDIAQYVDTGMIKRKALGIWFQSLEQDQTLIRVLASTEEAEVFLDLFEQNYGSIEGFSTIVVAVEASLPRDMGEEEADPGEEGSQQVKTAPPRISREELYQDITDAARLTTVYTAMVILSSIVAAIGVLRDNIAVIIGAMVIAPLLGPNMALALATTLGDKELAVHSVKANGTGIGLAFALAGVLGLVLTVDPSVHELASRTHVSLSDVVLALAAGMAGALAFTSGLSATLVGVMVAVALMPPLVAGGLLLGAGYGQRGLGALLLFGTNLICINLAGVLCFWAQGIYPLAWWEADAARRATRLAVFIWLLLLLALVVFILIGNRTPY